MNRSSSNHTAFFSAACLAMGVMVSPLSMPFAGNSAGMLGYALLWILPVAALLNFFTASQYYTVLSSQPESWPVPACSWFQTVFAVLQVVAFLFFCLAASTLILAAAGYVFNEVFVRWFPNLFFSVCLLVFILAVNFADSRVSGYFQIASVFLFSGAVLLLSVIGLLTLDRPLFGNVDVPGILSFEARPVFMLFWIFMAAELAMYHEKQNKTLLPDSYFLIFAFAVVFALFWLWSMVSIAAAPPHILVESTGPQNVAAHFIAGDTGRRIIGVALLAGSFAGVNLLLLGTGSVFNALVSPAAGKGEARKKVSTRNGFVAVLCLIILAMLLGGMAGKEITFTIKRAAFYLWLITYAGLNLYLLRHRASSGITVFVAASIGVSVIYIIAFVVLAATDPQLKEVIIF